MLPTWTLTVEKYGRIHKGSVTLAPLVLMVGKNNTGKSYLASLIWGILSNRSFFPSVAPDDSHYDECKALAASIRTGGKTSLDQSDWSPLVAWINAMLAEGRERLALNLIGNSDGAFQSATLTFDSIAPSTEVRCDIMPGSPRPIRLARSGKSRPPSVRTLRGPGKVVFRVFEDEITQRADEIDYFIVKALARTLICKTSLSALYIPAARTGLMLARKTLMAGLLQTMNLDGGDQKVSALPSPVVDFLQWLNFIEDDEEQDGFKIANYIEDNILEGRITTGENEEFIYSPNGTDLNLPFHASSSLVTELAPFVSFLKSGLHGTTLIFEEPEAHLHLGAQKILARALVRLVNSGVQVIITTHGDTLLQQINILMHLHEHPARQTLQAELGYSNEEILNPADARGYVFETTTDGTTVNEMKRVKAGFVDPLINQEITSLTREVFMLDQE